MKADLLLSRLERVRQTGAGRYVASCPAHKDKSPSLSILFHDDKRILMHCFAGCHIEEVVGAIGVAMSDLFPDRPLTPTFLPRSPLPLKPAEALLLIGHEAFVISLLAEELTALMRRGEIPSELGLDRMAKAIGRINMVRNYTESITPPEIQAIRKGLAA